MFDPNVFSRVSSSNKPMLRLRLACLSVASLRGAHEAYTIARGLSGVKAHRDECRLTLSSYSRKKPSIALVEQDRRPGRRPPCATSGLFEIPAAEWTAHFSDPAADLGNRIVGPAGNRAHQRVRIGAARLLSSANIGTQGRAIIGVVECAGTWRAMRDRQSRGLRLCLRSYLLRNPRGAIDRLRLIASRPPRT